MVFFLKPTLALILSTYTAYRLYRYLYPAEIVIEDVLFSGEDSMNCQNESGDTKNCLGCANERCFFSNINKMISIINSSRKSICLSMYIISNYDLTQAIIKAKMRGVYVRVITDHKMFDNNQNLEKMMRKGIPIRYKVSSDSIMHHKLCLIDTVETDSVAKVSPDAIKFPKQGIIMVGSQNWCLQALTVNYDNTIITTDIDLIEGLQEEFERMWLDFKTDVKPVDC